jgi:1-acyl-sn-glycerol-3-phosphate acyltransferase
MNLYPLGRAALRPVIPLVARWRVDGREHVPASGPFILALNHNSLLDGVFAQVACPRTVHTMTKSSQFRSGFFRWLLVGLQAFPVRRYQVDPQAVRTVLRLLGEGRGVGIYPEAERSWDGRPQPFRRGAIRLMLKAGVPVVPCGISGSYHVWPRWSRRPVRGEVHVRFGAPLHFGRHDGRESRDAALAEADAALRGAWGALIRDERDSPLEEA